MSNDYLKQIRQQIELAQATDLTRVQEAALGINSLAAGRSASSALHDAIYGNSGLQDVLKRIYDVEPVHEIISGRVRSAAETVAGINDSRWREALRGAYPPGSAAALAHSLHSQFSLPDTTQISKLLTGLDSYSASLREAFGGINGLQERMRAMHSPWLDTHRESLSMRSFADIQAIGGLASSVNAFSKGVAAALRLELGDWRDPISFDLAKLSDPFERIKLYDSRGFNPNLTHFSEEAYQETVQASGLIVVEDVEPETDESDDEFVLNSNAYQTLLRLEREIRAFIVMVMAEAFGTDWMKQRVPPETYKQWQDKKAIALKSGADELPLIEYADFTDYLKIIEIGNNWRDVFKPVFGRPEDVRESLQRLYPVRLATMHARIITLDDDLLLRSEATRIFNKLRRFMR